MSLLRRLGRQIARITTDAWRDIDSEAAREPRPKTNRDWMPVVVLVSVAIIMTLLHYWGHVAMCKRLLGRFYEGSEYARLYGRVWWCGVRVVGFFLVPLAIVKVVDAFSGSERLSAYGLSFRDFRRHLPTYVGLFLLVLVPVVFVSFTKKFQGVYPLYRLAYRSLFDLVIWELLYGLQFLSLEFFFRGYILAGLRRAMGSNAIWVMVVPYCLLHYGKPLPETLGAIVAGAALGTLAMKTRSIWGGVLIHFSVALSMDLLSLLQRGSLPGWS